MHNHTPWLALLALTTGGIVCLRGAVYDVPMGSSAVLRLNIPDSLKTVRGIYLWGNGGTTDGRNRATDPEMVAVAGLFDFAVIGCSGVSIDFTDTTVDIAPFEASLAELARISGHPEIIRAPLLPIGHSNGGNTAYDLNAAIPERVIATELAKSGNCQPLPKLLALKTPGLLVAGETDTPERISDIRARFFDNRARGALWAWVEEQGVDHAQLDSPEIAWPFAELVTRLRYPSSASPVTSPVSLLDVPESDGWLTDPDSYKTGLAEIASYSTYTKDKSRAGWLPNRRAAYIFRAFASYNKATPTATISPSNRLVDPGATITYTIAPPSAAWNSIEFYEGDTLLKQTTPSSAEALSVQYSTSKTGYVVLHALVTFSDGRQRTTMPRRALVRVPPSGSASATPDVIVKWGAYFANTQTVLNQFGIQSIAAGSSHGLGLKRNGTVIAWGSNTKGQATVPPGLNDVVSIDAGADVSGAVRGDGTVAVWGDNQYGQLNVPAGLNTVRQISIGSRDVIALQANGTLVSWGMLSSPLPEVNDAVAVASKNSRWTIVKADGTIVTSPFFGAPAGLNHVIAVSIGGYGLALKDNGTVVCWNPVGNGENNIPANLTNAIAVAASFAEPFALKPDGKIAVWGNSAASVAALPTLPHAAAIAIDSNGSNYLLAGTTLGIDTQPQGQFAREGDEIEFSVGVVTDRILHYQWRKDGIAIIGATRSTYSLSSAKPSDAGSYDVIVSDGGSNVVSSSAVLSFPGQTSGGSGAPRFINVSTRSLAGTGANVQIGGFVIGGDTPKRVVIRAAGPALTQFGVSGVLADPHIDLYDGANRKLVSNDDWDAKIASDFEKAGAWSWPVGSKDAGLAVTLSPGLYSAIVSSSTGATGVALVEVYDEDREETGSRLINLSTRSLVGTGGDAQIAGFIITGNSAKTVLIRASGPALAQFGVPGLLPDPVLMVYNGASVKIAENDDWNASLAADFKSAGAWSWTPGSKDAALVLTLAPGAYTAIVTGKTADPGVALVEVYEEN